jgi:tRNA threonylcarbamoyladenosine biosynthesis protein TsaE
MVADHKQPMLHLTRHLASERDTLALGSEIAPGLRGGMVIYLCGELGAGKTTLARGILRALGHTGRIKSPSFPLVELYILSSLYFYHFDFYRFKSDDEWLDAGFRDCFSSESVCLVEWPEKAGNQLPAPDLRIELHLAESGREAKLAAYTEAGTECIKRLGH